MPCLLAFMVVNRRMIHVIIDAAIGLLRGGCGCFWPHALPQPQMIIQILGGHGNAHLPTPGA